MNKAISFLLILIVIESNRKSTGIENILCYNNDDKYFVLLNLLISMLKDVLHYKRDLGLFWFMVINDTFNNISVISWRSVLLVEETGVL